MLSLNQRKAIDGIKSRKGTFHLIKGSAGTGKSFLIKRLVQELNELGRVVLLSASTGQASSIIGGYTADKLFGIPTGIYNPQYSITAQRRRYPQFRYFNSDALRATEVFVIDEISMVPCDKFDAIDSALRHACKNDKPFGGKTIVAVGDLGQLMPVVTKPEILNGYGYEAPYTFEKSKVWPRIQPVVTTLTEVFRQSDLSEAALLNRVRTNTLTSMDFQRINSRVMKCPDSAIVITPKRRTASALNRHKNSLIPNESYFFQRESKGKVDSDLEEALPEILEIRRGARVIIKRNIQREWSEGEFRVVNGDQGCFLGLDKYDRACIHIDRLNDIIPLRREKVATTVPYVEEREDGSCAIRDRETGSVKQYPFDLGFAITVHQSQGSTIARVHVSLPPNPVEWAANLLYVALTRAPSLKSITLSRPITRADIISTESVEGDQQYKLLDE